MTTTPKSVILAVVLLLGAAALIGLVGTIYLIDQGHATGAEIALVSSPTVFALGVLGGVLGSPRTTPDLPPGAVLTTGTTTLTTPTAAENIGETFSGQPLTARVVDVPDVPRVTTLDAPLALEDHAQA